ncbi:MAG TPA: transglycosylase domain-containing protein [Candidatus Eisenbacteria bacterium]|nr:transglycosylase domain-containing protein [Candidatus Eisenbacteria bacterium]
MVLASTGLILLAWVEFRTAALESLILSRTASWLSFQVQPGPSPWIVFPRHGPSDLERGYAAIPEITRKLEARGFQRVEQARFSAALILATRLGISPPYRGSPAAGLVIRGADGAPLHDATPRERVISRLEDLPPVVVSSLLFIENRELQRPSGPWNNPAVEWGRFAKASLLQAGRSLGLPLPRQGGSTLAVQIEKYNHSADGRTGSPLDKVRQVVSASLGAYRNGPDTRAARHEIVLDYLSTVPLASRPGSGEVFGLKQGLRGWFGLEPEQVFRALRRPGDNAATARALKPVLAILCAIRAPTHYLVEDSVALEERTARYARLLAQEGVLTPELAQRVIEQPLGLVSNGSTEPVAFAQRKDSDLVRRNLLALLPVRDYYSLDRLDLEVETTIDTQLQEAAERLLRSLANPDSLDANGLRGERLLPSGDPRAVVYSLALYERSAEGDLMRVHVDNLNRPFDVIKGMKLELGSTAKLRALAHYLEVMADLYEQARAPEAYGLPTWLRTTPDPLTRWAAETLTQEPNLPLQAFLERALDRTYSANPGEVFLTGGGSHVFGNFDPEDDGRVLSIREATVRSTNLVFIRMMRDLVRYHVARLPWNAEAVLTEPDHPVRKSLLIEAADEEARLILARADRVYRNLAPDGIPDRLLGPKARSPESLAALFFAWNPGAGYEALFHWLEERVGGTTVPQAMRLTREYGNPRLTLADYGFLLGRHPLDVWCAGERVRNPDQSWKELLSRSQDVRRASSAWLFQTRHRGAQDQRIRARIEQAAFARMTPAWRRLGYPFERMVPSYASAIGSSGDRPEALAELMGIIVNDGVRRQPRLLRRLHFAPGLPYHTAFAPPPPPDGEQVMVPDVAHALRGALADVVERGTARRIRGAFTDSSSAAEVIVGGKTGSGDNRFEIHGRHGQLIGSRATSRSAAFAFFIGDRYYGVLTASVEGPKAAQYVFTSALPLEVLKRLSPVISERLGEPSGDLAATVAAPARPAAATAPAPAHGPRALVLPRSPRP